MSDVNFVVVVAAIGISIVDPITASFFAETFSSSFSVAVAVAVAVVVSVGSGTSSDGDDLDLVGSSL